MPPKRKAPATTQENEPPQTRRRTRSTATAGEPTEVTPAELPPPKRTRRVAKAKEDTANAAEVDTQVSSTTAKETTKTTRTTRTRKAESANSAEVVAAPKPSAPKRRGRVAKAQPAEEQSAEALPEEPAAPRQPLSPIPEKTAQTVPKKRGRAKAQDTAVAEASVAGSSRPTRARRGKAATNDAPESHHSHSDVQPPLPSQDASTTVPKKRVRTKATAPARRPETPPPVVNEDSSDDELLLTPSKRTSARPTTPMRTGGSRVGTPRMIMHSVEITTPRRFLNTVRRDLGSPGPRVHVPPLGTPRLPPAFPAASPQKRSAPAPSPSAARSRATRTPSPEPLPHQAEAVRSPTKTSPSKRQRGQPVQQDDRLPTTLPLHLHPLLERQKRAILQALQRPPEIDEIDIYGEDYPPTNILAYEQLSDLLSGTVTRGEGNSCLLIGPSGSGKTQMVERAIAALPGNPIVVRLSGYAQQNDRLAIREIAWQLAQQTGQSFLPANEEADDEDEPPAAPAALPIAKDADDNPFIDPSPGAEAGPGLSVTLPPPAHLLALISMIPTLPRPTIIVLDEFDLFASHARQALLYCLLDTAQACRAGPTTAASGARSASGMAVIGVTARVDTINLLEKRVKSRFSGRMIRTAGPARVSHWVAITKAVIGSPLEQEGEDRDTARGEWDQIWEEAVKQFVEDEATLDALRETYALTRDYQMLRQILTCMVLELTASSPYPTAAKLEAAINRQRCPPRLPPLHTLTYPAICLLIAAVHAQTSGHDVFTFEMLHEAFKNQVRTSQSAPVHIEGGGIGMVRCSREVLFAAFERLADLRIFLSAAAPGSTVGREFALYRSAVDRFAVKKAVETMGQLNLKKWFTKAQ
ncbi:origin recognition complex subunit 4 C-terminus-domain-containing protein [Cubamyces lactineus]|nr:origin recognition complex subunit 4 C-terminus-domain-containing protein [Cubamyces lactineus]